jgi:hypothetical protein
MKIIVDDYNTKLSIDNTNYKLDYTILKNLSYTNIEYLSIRSISGVSLTDYRFLNSSNSLKIVELDSFYNINPDFFLSVEYLHIGLMTDTNFRILFRLPKLSKLGFDIIDKTILSNTKFYTDLNNSNIKHLVFNTKLDKNLEDLVVKYFGYNNGNEFIKFI